MSIRCKLCGDDECGPWGLEAGELYCEGCLGLIQAQQRWFRSIGTQLHLKDTMHTFMRALAVSLSHGHGTCKHCGALALSDPCSHCGRGVNDGVSS